MALNLYLDDCADIEEADIVAAIAKIEAASPLGYPIAGEFHTLNDWR